MCKYQCVNVIACLLASLYILVSAAVADFVMSPGGFHDFGFSLFCMFDSLFVLLKHLQVTFRVNNNGAATQQ